MCEYGPPAGPGVVGFLPYPIVLGVVAEPPPEPPGLPSIEG